jgi:alkylated DNA repair dioxygenase AlkB
LSEQFDLFVQEPVQEPVLDPQRPEGLGYQQDFISAATEKALIEQIAALPLQPFQFGQYEGKRRVASFGIRYDYDQRQLQEAKPIPDWLTPLIEKVEAFGGPGTRIGQVLCTEYDVGVGIGTGRTTTGCSACRWVPPASSGFEDLLKPSGNASRWRPSLVRSI